jgi:hypothetical protein
MIRNKALLFIEPLQLAVPTPVIDSITRRMCAAFRIARPSDYAYGGVHSCYCGATSSACDYHLPSGELTNSLCVHYIAHHRADVPRQDLLKVEAFNFGETEPNEQELLGPQSVLSGIRALIERRLASERLNIWIEWGLDVSALAEGLRGGCLPSPKVFTAARREAEDLFTVISSIPCEALPSVAKAAMDSHGSLKAWGADALSVSGWKREAWLIPLARIMELSDKVLPDKRLLAMSVRLVEQRNAGQ